jgi:hypothetical protein
LILNSQDLELSHEQVRLIKGYVRKKTIQKIAFCPPHNPNNIVLAHGTLYNATIFNVTKPVFIMVIEDRTALKTA